MKHVRLYRGIDLDRFCDGAKDQSTIADLEIYGISVRLINALEEQFGFLYVDELVELTAPQVRGAPSLGPAAVAELRAGLRNFLKGRVVRSAEECSRKHDSSCE